MYLLNIWKGPSDQNEGKSLVNSRRKVKTQIYHIPPIKLQEIINEMKTSIDKKNLLDLI
jgi:hypothetical protein